MNEQTDELMMFCRACDAVMQNTPHAYLSHSLDGHDGSGWRAVYIRPKAIPPHWCDAAKVTHGECNCRCQDCRVTREIASGKPGPFHEPLAAGKQEGPDDV